MAAVKLVREVLNAKEFQAVWDLQHPVNWDGEQYLQGKAKLRAIEQNKTQIRLLLQSRLR